MSRSQIGRTVRRLRTEKSITQQALAARLGVSASYLNLIEHGQRNVTGSLLIKLCAALDADLQALSGETERQAEIALREVLRDPLFGGEPVPDTDIQTLAGLPGASRAMVSLYRALRVAREDAAGIALPSGRRILLPLEETRDFFQQFSNYFPAIEEAAEARAADINNDADRFILDRLQQRHGVRVRIGSGEMMRRFHPETRLLELSEAMPRESRAFQLAFQLMLLECRPILDAIVADARPSTPEAAGMIRVGLCNYAAGALLMPYAAMISAATELRYDVDALAARFGVSFEQVAHRLTSLQRPGAAAIPFFFVRTDPAGNIDKCFSAAGFPFARFGGSCPRWIVHTAFSAPDRLCVEVAELPDGAAFLCVARMLSGTPGRPGDPPPRHVVTIGCAIDRASELVYVDQLNLAHRNEIGLSCRLCDRAHCRNRAFPPVLHRLEIDPNQDGAAPWRFSPERGR
ncbi:short-chain fatty acyl-CoA regulator family protein [Acetobacteraceae bacterium KSS8]|uniref:Short-chain fatty acyl-CoA regulator family protein n=1 Tax=Endosaccharibacter trunci TaxID=2812733 RepID=A0ABT1W3K8_9PROT|nr:short-chain fatty acyl-CoA regulator family protein [Acetobacteraceae bacterium KSS8]